MGEASEERTKGLIESISDVTRNSFLNLEMAQIDIALLTGIKRRCVSLGWSDSAAETLVLDMYRNVLVKLSDKL